MTRLAARPIVHVGIHKALSSWLQSTVFTPSGPVHTGGLTWDELGDSLVRGLDESWVDRLASVGRRHEHFGMSWERLSGYPASGGFDRAAIAERLHRGFPDARIVLVIREQRDAIWSYSAQYVADGGADGYRRLTRPISSPRGRLPHFEWSYYEYSRLIELFDSRFGRENVLVLTHEGFAVDSAAWIEKLENFVGITIGQSASTDRVNARRPLAELMLLRALHRTIVRTDLAPGGLVETRRLDGAVRRARPMLAALTPTRMEDDYRDRIRRDVEARCGELFRHDNRELASRIDDDLGALGYLVE